VLAQPLNVIKLRLTVQLLRPLRAVIARVLIFWLQPEFFTFIFNPRPPAGGQGNSNSQLNDIAHPPVPDMNTF